MGGGGGTGCSLQCRKRAVPNCARAYVCRLPPLRFKGLVAFLELSFQRELNKTKSRRPSLVSTAPGLDKEVKARIYRGGGHQEAGRAPGIRHCHWELELERLTLVSHRVSARTHDSSQGWCTAGHSMYFNTQPLAKKKRLSLSFWTWPKILSGLGPTRVEAMPLTSLQSSYTWGLKKIVIIKINKLGDRH